MSTPSAEPAADPAAAIQRQQQRNAELLLQRLEQVQVQDLVVHYSLEHSSVTLPGALIRFVAVAVLFRLDSMKKWRFVLQQQLLPEPVGKWLRFERLADLVGLAKVDWVPPAILLDALAWQVADCLTQCAVPQPAAVIRQTIAVLLLRDAKQCGEGITLDGGFWRRVAAKGERPLAAAIQAECQRRIEFVLGQVDLSEVVPGRWLDMPQLTVAERAKLEATRVAQPDERLQALQAAFDEGMFDFVAKLLACSYSRHGRRPHHPLLLLKIWLTIFTAKGQPPGEFLRDVDDSVQYRLFLEVMCHEKLPSERRIKGFLSERLSPVIEYLVLWHQFALLKDQGIEIGTDFGTDAGDVHSQARMKYDAAAKHIPGLLGWILDECRRFCEATGRAGLSEEDRAVLLRAFEELDWKSLGNFGRNRQGLIGAIRETLGGRFVTPGRERDAVGLPAA